MFCKWPLSLFFMDFKQLAYTNTAPFEQPELINRVHHTHIPGTRMLSSVQIMMESGTWLPRLDS